MSLLFTLTAAFALLLAAVTLGLAWRLRRQLHRERDAANAARSERERLIREHAAASERERIFNDLHDDLGARLLGWVHGARSSEEADAARALLQDLRDVVTRSRGTPGTLTDVLADIRAEAAPRLARVTIALDWEQPEALPDPAFDTGRALHLQRIVREALSNVVRHAGATRVRIRIAAARGQLLLELTDDGSGAGVDAPASGGTGLQSMRARAQALAGDIDWLRGTVGGTKILLSVPLEMNA